MVINIGFLKDGRYEEVEEEIKACEIVTNAGAEFIKTSTGFSTAGATFDDVALMIEIFGYIGCIFVIISMLMTSVVKLRVINIYNLIKLSKADGNHYDMIRGNKEDSYLTYFIKHYKEDMKKYFLENTLELSAADTIYTVCCEGVPAGVLARKKTAFM